MREFGASGMTGLEILDTFPAFERYWRRVRSEPIRVQIDRWQHEYLAPWPELLEKLQRNYTDQGVDWRRIARTRIFPQLPNLLPRIRRLHRRLREGLPTAWSRSKKVLRIDFPVQVVIYVGIGVGAGWATRYAGRPACLFGLENAAEMVSGRDPGTSGAVSHEIAHLAHAEWRRRRGRDGLGEARGPYWQLYVEGFATECERRIDPPEEFHLRTGKADWLPWCERHRGWLAARFLRQVRNRRPVREYFGSWYKVQGQIESGYYLGQQVVHEWLRASSLQEVALLPAPEVRRRTRSTLRRMADIARSE
jgi:hypothetical protein